MARDFGRIRSQFWDDEDLKACAPATKMLALYLLTSNHTNAIGCFRLPAAYILSDTNLDVETLETALAELRNVGFMKPCERVPWIWIPNYLKHNPLENPNVWRKCVKELALIPGEVSAAPAIAAQLIEIASEPRMSNPNSKTRVSDEEITVLKRYENGIETLPKGKRPFLVPCPVPEPLPEPSSLRSDVGAHREKSGASQSQPKSTGPTEEAQAVQAYNDVAKDLDWPQAQVLTRARSVTLCKRLAGCGGIEGWRAAMAKARASPFLRGETGRDETHASWTPDFDFFLQQSSFTKLMEGKYDQRGGNQKSRGFDALREGARRAAGLDGGLGPGLEPESDPLRRLASSTSLCLANGDPPDTG